MFRKGIEFGWVLVGDGGRGGAVIEVELDLFLGGESEGVEFGEGGMGGGKGEDVVEVWGDGGDKGGVVG